MKRLILLVLCLCLLLGRAAAEPLEISVAFPATDGGARLTQPMTADFTWFNAPSGEYNHQLAKMSICMAVASFRDVQVPLPESNHFIREFFEKTGFTGYRAYSYDKAPGADTISNSIARMDLCDDRGEYVLLAVPVCGQGYGDEWLSNFTIDDGRNHAGFMRAASAVYARLMAYITENQLEGRRLKFWCAGFSRAAAVSNLLGHMLISDSRFEDDNVFVYTFGTPNTTKEPIPYPQIHNICGSFDPVPKIPFADWGFGKHGVTHYLPALETDDQYPAEQSRAEEVYLKLMGTDAHFASDTNRNWFISELLQLLYEYIPEATAYSESYQAAVIAAYSAKGSVLDKLNAMLDFLDLQGEDTAGMQHVRDELMGLVSIGFTDTVNALSGNGGSTMWVDLLSSGMQLAHEHFPETYISWIFSTDDTDLLYGQGSQFSRLVLTGDVEVTITDGDKVLMGPNVNHLAVSRIENQLFVSLPVGHTYEVDITARGNTRCQVAFSHASVNRVSIPLMTNNPITLATGEFIHVHVPAFRDEDDRLQVALNGQQVIALYNGGNGGRSSRLLDDTLSNSSQEVRYIINSAIIMVPWLVCGIILLVYLASIFIKRLVRGRINDSVSCRKPGRIILMAAACLAALACGSVLSSIVRNAMTVGSVTMPNRTLQRASEFMGWSIDAFLASQLIIYGFMAWLCVRSVHHQLGRIRLVRLSVALLLLDLITIFLGGVLGTLGITEYLSQLLPLLALIGLLLSVSLEDQRRMVGKRWLPVSRTIFFTALVFFVRQGYVFVYGSTALPAVVMKALSGVPVLLLALLVWQRRQTRLTRMMLSAIACYFVANTVINLSMPLALAIYTLGHCLLAYGCIREKALGRVHLIMWALASILFVLQLFVLLPGMDALSKGLSVLYVIALMSLLVSAGQISHRFRLGALMFFLSNQILGITLVFPGDFLTESVELLLYYIAIIILATDPQAMTEDNPRSPTPTLQVGQI